jgi:hypothetical protein
MSLETGVDRAQDVPAADLRSRQNAWMEALSDADRVALIRGEGFPSRRRKYLRLIRGVSEEADGLFVLLERAGGERSARSLQRTIVGGFVKECVSELEQLGLVERVGRGESAAIRLTPRAAGMALVSTWSRR